MNALDVLDRLETTPGQNDKIAILKANLHDKELEELLDAAMNFDRKYYVKKFNSESLGLPGMITHIEFMNLLSQLEKREITGHEAIKWVEHLLSHCTEQQAKWYSRVLRKDLRCSFGISLANKAGFNLHEFEVMLAKDGKECKKLPALVREGVYASPKFNGYRALAICHYGHVVLHSRNGLEYENFTSIVNTLEKLCQDSSFILDGEVMSDDFNKMQQTAMSAVSGKTVGDIRYHVFGWVPVGEWASKQFKMPTGLRLRALNEFFARHEFTLSQEKNVVEVEHKLIYSVDDALAFEKECLAAGYEGAMLLPNIPYYVGKKSNKLLKLKTFQSMECLILDVYEGQGKNAGRMGGLNLKQENGHLCDLGSGFSDEDRDYIWNNKDEFIGRVVECSYQELTPHGVMQFPTFIRFRNDKDL